MVLNDLCTRYRDTTRASFSASNLSNLARLVTIYLNIPVPQIILYKPRIGALVGQGNAAAHMLQNLPFVRHEEMRIVTPLRSEGFSSVHDKRVHEGASICLPIWPMSDNKTPCNVPVRLCALRTIGQGNPTLARLGGGMANFVSRTINGRSYWIPGSYVTSTSMSAPSNALPRFRTLCTNSKKPR